MRRQLKLRYGILIIMESKHELFGKILSIDTHLANLKGRVDGLCIRGREISKISLFTPAGKIISMVPQSVGNGPDFIVCEKLPDATTSLPADDWSICDKQLRMPGLPALSLSQAKKFDSLEKSEVRDFPGHMEGMITSRLRLNRTEEEIELQVRLNRLAKELKQYEIESVEVPIINLLAFGESKPSAGDIAICAMLLTARCFVAGKRFKVTWFNRFAMETRRFLHRSNAFGKNWIDYALEGRTTSSQQDFFKAMSADFEAKDELVIKAIEKTTIYSGRAFLMGVSTALEMIRERYL